MAKVLFEKIFEVALKKKNEKNFQNLQGVEVLCERKKKNSNLPERIKIASKEKYFQSPSFESKKKNSELLLLP